MFKESHKTEDENMEQAAEWSQECLEYLFDNKIFLPGVVRSESFIVQ